uniref:Uncharacterized protein n=2 Tax=Strongyloides stercoralis TaxID=6248 RepID=A0AAF5CUW8_STRER
MALKKRDKSDVSVDDSCDEENEDEEGKGGTGFSPSLLKYKTVHRLKTAACYHFLNNLMDQITVSQGDECDEDTMIRRICVKTLGKALLFNSNPEDENRILCYDHPVNIIDDYDLEKYQQLHFIKLFLISRDYRYRFFPLGCVRRKNRKLYKIPIEINKNHFKHTKYLWIRDRFNANSVVNQNTGDRSLRILPHTIQHSYHNSFVLSMKNMYEDAVLCFLGYPLIKEEFSVLKKVNRIIRPRIETFLLACSKIIPDVFNIIIYCAMKCHFSEEKRNKFFSQMLDFCKYISNFGIMEKDVLISCIFSVLTYDLHFRPEIVPEKYKEIEIKDVYRIQSYMLKYNACINISLFLKWKKNEANSDNLPVYLFEQLKDIVIDGNTIEFIPVLEAFLFLICKFDLLTEYFYIILNAVKSCPTILPRVATRLYQENEFHFAKIIERSLEPSVDLHPSHEAWITYLENKSTQIGKNTDVEKLMEDIRIIVRLLDYGKWRKSEKVWSLFNEYLFIKTKRKKRVLLKDYFKSLFQERQNWWFKFHSVELPEDINVIRDKILNFITEICIN